MAAKKFGAIRTLIKTDRDRRRTSQSGYVNAIPGLTLPTLQRWEAGTASPGGLMTARLIASGIPAEEMIKAFEEDAAQSEK